jgi:hypothetical protein
VFCIHLLVEAAKSVAIRPQINTVQSACFAEVLQPIRQETERSPTPNTDFDNDPTIGYF